MAFSLIMVMVRYPCSVVFGVARTIKGRESVRVEHDIESDA